MEVSIPFFSWQVSWPVPTIARKQKRHRSRVPTKRGRGEPQATKCQKSSTISKAKLLKNIETLLQVGGSDSRLSVSSPSALPRLHAHRSQPSLAQVIKLDFLNCHHHQPLDHFASLLSSMSPSSSPRPFQVIIHFDNILSPVIRNVSQIHI